MDIWLYAAVAILGFISAFVGSVAAGAGLVAMPGLLALGIPPHIALGTFNLGSIGFRIGNIVKFAKHKNMGVPWKDILILSLIAVPATAIGAVVVISVDPESLSKIIGFVFLTIFPFIFLKGNWGIVENRATGIRRRVSHVLFFLSRLWAGFFSPGSGILETYIKMRSYGYTILQGKAATRIPYILADGAGVIVFAFSALVNYQLAIALFVGMLAGGYAGTAFAIEKGDKWLKWLTAGVVLITVIKLIFFS